MPTGFRARDVDNHTRRTMRCLVRRESFQIEVRTRPTHGLQPRRMGGRAGLIVLGRWLVHAAGRWKMRNEIRVALHDLVSPRHLTCIYDLIGPTSGGGGCPLCRVTGVTMCVCMCVCVCVETRRDMAVLSSTQNRHAAWPPPSAVFLTPAQRTEPPPALLLLLLLLLLSSCRYSCCRRCSFSTQHGGGFAADKSVCAAALEKKGGRCLVRCGVCMCACTYARVCVVKKV